MNTIRLRAIAATGVTLVTLGCGDIPILPQWDADLYAPIGSANHSGVSGTIPANTTVPVGGEVRRLEMDGTAGQVLDQVLSDWLNEAADRIRIEVRVAKSANLAVGLADTLFLAADSASLATTTVKDGIVMPAGATVFVDTLDAIPGLIPLVQQLVDAEGTLWMEARGSAASGANPVTVQPGDSIHVQIGLLIRVPVTRGN